MITPNLVGFYTLSGPARDVSLPELTSIEEIYFASVGDGNFLITNGVGQLAAVSGAQLDVFEINGGTLSVANQFPRLNEPSTLDVDFGRLEILTDGGTTILFGAFGTQSINGVDFITEAVGLSISPTGQIQPGLSVVLSDDPILQADRNSSFVIEEFQAVYDGEIDYFLFSVDTDGLRTSSSFATDQILLSRAAGGEFGEFARWKNDDLSLDRFAIVDVNGSPVVIREDEQLNALTSYRADNTTNTERPQGVISGVDDSSTFSFVHAVLEAGDRSYLYVPYSSGIAAIEVFADGTMTELQRLSDGTLPDGGNWGSVGVELAIATLFDAPHLFVSDTNGSEDIVIFSIEQDGRLRAFANIDLDEFGVDFRNDEQIVVETVEGRTMMYVAGDSNPFFNNSNSIETQIAVLDLGPAGPAPITGTDQGETLSGTSGNDILIGLGGDDLLQGRDGSDTALFSGSQNSYTLRLGSSSTILHDRRLDGNGTDTLVSIEVLDFDTDLLGVPFDLVQFGGLAGMSAIDLESFIELYIAYFNRAPDAVGLNFWGTAFANGTTLEQMATLFVDQEETRATYPQGTTNSNFAESVYNNVLGRTPDQAGIDFWVGALDSNAVSRDQFILEVIRGAKADLKPEEGQAFVDQQLADRAYLENKIDIGAYFSVHLGMSDVTNASTAMALFNGTTASLDAAVSTIDGFYQDAVDPLSGEFLMQVVGVLDNPFGA
jgi:hypothetical protein